MKFLHTSDLHLGKALHGTDRTSDEIQMLADISRIAKEKNVDAILIAGDIFDTARPSAAVQQIFAQFLSDLTESLPDAKIIAMAGNHDSGARLEIFSSLLRRQGIYMLGKINPDDPAASIVHIPGKGYVAAVPYTHERNLPPDFYRAVIQEIGNRNAENLPVILMAHTTMEGCDATGHDHPFELSVGGIDSIAADMFGSPDAYDYVALGHIHKPQSIHSGASASAKIRYCGSPLAAGFDESYPHGVDFVEIASRGASPERETIEISPLTPLVTIPSAAPEPWEVVVRKLAEFPADIPALLRLNVLVEGFLPPEAADEARALCSDKLARLCFINACRKEAARADSLSLTVSEFRSRNPLEIAREYALSQGVEFTHDLQEIFIHAASVAEQQTDI